MCRMPLRVVTVYQHSISHTPASVGGPRSTVALCRATCSHRRRRHTDDCCLDVLSKPVGCDCGKTATRVKVLSQDYPAKLSLETQAM